MKQLVILRHGKAEQDTMAKDDYDRVLTDRGIKNASDMGGFILKKWASPTDPSSSQDGHMILPSWPHKALVIRGRDQNRPESLFRSFR
jgi:hypothetical protein